MAGPDSGYELLCFLNTQAMCIRSFGMKILVQCCYPCSLSFQVTMPIFCCICFFKHLLEGEHLIVVQEPCGHNAIKLTYLTHVLSTKGNWSGILLYIRLCSLRTQCTVPIVSLFCYFFRLITSFLTNFQNGSCGRWLVKHLINNKKNNIETVDK